MLQYTDKKYNYFFYVFLLLLLSTINSLSLIDSKNTLSKVRIIEVTGLENKINEKIKNKLGYLLNTNIYSIYKTKLKKKLNDYNFIENYKVSKVYPSKIIIDLNKTDFIATTLQNDKKYIVGANGKLIDSDLMRSETELPNIFGTFSSENFILLIEKIKNSNFNYEEINNFYVFPSGRWDIQTKNNLIIKLPKDNLEKSLININKMINDEKFVNNKIIDLRIQNQIIILDE